jgi:D-amino-acid dehydrogenase
MASRSDVLVVGAGIIGVSTAYYLAARGRFVTVVDAGEIGAGCSYGNAGFVGPSDSLPLPAPGVVRKALRWMFDPDSPFYVRFRWDRALWSWLWKFRAACSEDRARRAIPVLRDLSLASMALYDEIMRLGGMEDCAFTRRGQLTVFRTQHGLAAGLKEAALLAEYGVRSEILDGAAARTIVPALSKGVVGAVRFPDDAHLEPAAFVRGLARHAERLGATFLTRTEVLGFDVTAGRISTVRTTRGVWHPDEVVLAAGSWSPGLARDLDLKLPIEPAKGYSISLAQPASAPTLSLLLAEAKIGVTPMGRFLRLAGTLELAGLDLSINDRRVNAIRRGAREFLDGLDGLQELEIWRGLRPCTPDGLPILGRPRGIENLIVATGHAMVGVSLGPVTGKLVAEMAAREPPSLDLSLLAPDRF